MNTTDFARDLLTALAVSLPNVKVDLQTEGPIVQGRAYINPETFLAFYFNQVTQTHAFALVKQAQRVWGIDFDSGRGWHKHPINNPADHLPIEPQSISAIIEEFKHALDELKIR